MLSRLSALLVLCILGLPGVSAKSSKEESDHRKDCRFKSDGAYDRYNVSCAPAAKVPKPKPVKKQVADDLRKK